MQSFAARSLAPSARPAALSPHPASGRALDLHQVVGYPLAGKLGIACARGLLWVTGPGSGDVVLSAGQHVVLRGRGRVVIEALCPSSVVFRGAVP